MGQFMKARTAVRKKLNKLAAELHGKRRQVLFQQLKKFLDYFWMQYLALMPRQHHPSRSFNVDSMASLLPG